MLHEAGTFEGESLNVTVCPSTARTNRAPTPPPPMSQHTASELTAALNQTLHLTEPQQFKPAASQSNTETGESQLVQRLHSPEHWTRME